MTEKAFEFDLVLALPEGADEGAILDALYEVGCDDAVVGLGASGLIGLGFTRAGEDPEAVISETVKQVLKGLPQGTRLREVKPDLVSLADVAARLKVTRQALQKRRMPPPSLGGLYRASEMPPYLDAVPGKLKDGFRAAEAWFAAAPGAQRVNSRIGLDDFEPANLTYLR
ncbi:MAG: hypothetical protein OXU42_05715 [Deltaproteobacteria bacterium]|nr:hypothetical protein [Deltaproteobacteria bacterium]